MPGRVAKQLLALIRIVNGALALVAPDVLGKRLQANTKTSPGFGYAFRLFGVRTVLLGVQLWRAPDDPNNHVVREALLVHASDTVAATVVYRRGELPKKGALMAITASAINTVLALIMNWRLRSKSS